MHSLKFYMYFSIIVMMLFVAFVRKKYTEHLVTWIFGPVDICYFILLWAFYTQFEF